MSTYSAILYTHSNTHRHTHPHTHTTPYTTYKDAQNKDYN